MSMTRTEAQQMMLEVLASGKKFEISNGTGAIHIDHELENGDWYWMMIKPEDLRVYVVESGSMTNRRI